MTLVSTGTKISLLALSVLVMTACAEKSQAPESLTLKMMRMQAEAGYQSDIDAKSPQSLKKLNRAAFVCCAMQGQGQELWAQVAAKDPELVVFAGNSVSSVRFDEKPLLAQYKKLDQVEGYRKLRQQVPFMAVWDEFDFGLRDGDSSFDGKIENRQAFLNYWNYIPKLQSASAKGVEHSIIIGPPGQRVQILMLDTRFHATPWLTSGAEFKKNWNGTDSLLGKDQWSWLEAELRKEADFRIVVSPLQLAANFSNQERWGLFPLDRQRFFDTLRAVRAKKVLVVSGGRGFGTLGKVDLLEGYGPLYDLTVGPLNGDVSRREKDFHYVGKALEGPNFGLVEWDWKKRSVRVKLVDASGTVVEEVKL